MLLRCSSKTSGGMKCTSDPNDFNLNEANSHGFLPQAPQAVMEAAFIV